MSRSELMKPLHPGRAAAHLLAWALLLLGLLGGPHRAWSAETGTLRGSVIDAANEQPLIGVLVTITGAGLPSARAKETDARGNFWFPVLPPGEYRVTFSREGYQTVEATSSVVLDQTTTLPPIRLPLIEFQMDVIEIIESAPVLDTTTSAVVTNVSTDYFDRLPLPRTYAGVIRSLPGVSGRINYVGGGSGGANPSVRGEGQEGNNYLLEGFSIRDPYTQGVGISIPTDAIQEMSVFTDGAPAEYGTFTGMVANILLKAGENETHGSLRLGYDTTDPWDGFDLREEPQFRTTSGVMTLGGAVVPDKLWYFSSATLRRSDEHALQSADQVAAGTPLIYQPTPYDYLLTNRFTYSAGEDGATLFNFTVLAQGREQLNVDDTPGVTADAQSNFERKVLDLNANMKSVLSDSVVFEAKWNRWRVESNFLPASGDYTAAAYENVETGALSNNADVGILDTRSRDGLAFHMTKFVVEMLGQHVFKGGYEWHSASNTQDYRWTGGVGTEEVPAVSYQVDGDGNLISRTEHVNVGPLTHSSAIDVLFLQDQWQPITNLTINAGARADHFRLYAVDNLKLTDQWAASPRLGVAWDVDGSAQSVISFNAGRYYDINGLGMANWGDTRSRDYYRVCEYDEETGTFSEDEDGCVVQDPALEPSVFSDALRPYGMDKLTLGYERVLPQQISVGMKAIASRTFNLPEDVNTNDYYWEIRNPETKQRNYEALEWTAKRRWRDGWQLMGSYTLSRARGVMPGQDEVSPDGSSSSGNEVGVFMDNPSDPFVRGFYDWLGPMYGLQIYNGLGYDAFTSAQCPTDPSWTYDCGANDEGYYGYLPYHSFHNVKLSGSYQMPWGTELGVIAEYDSGHAYERKGYILLYGYSTFPEGRGSRLMPPLYYLDVSLAHHIALPDDRELEVEVAVFNILNLRRPTNYVVSFDQHEDWAQSEGANAGFGTDLYLQDPRSFQTSLKLTF